MAVIADTSPLNYPLLTGSAASAIPENHSANAVVLELRNTSTHRPLLHEQRIFGELQWSAVRGVD